MSPPTLLAVSLTFIATLGALAQPRISDDQDLKEYDLSTWDCLNKLEGSAKTPDGQERNRGKDRSATNLAGLTIPDFDSVTFHKLIGPFDQANPGGRRKDIAGPQRTQMEEMEKKIVSLTGYLVYAYAGPPESTNCGSVDFHDWHLEVFEKPSDHPPRAGDPTPIICEITPRTQNEIYKAGVRLVDLAAFMRRPDESYEATGHAAKKIRLTGYLLWDDDHNGSADVGPSIQSAPEGRYHNPWRSTAWEIHPVLKIEPLDVATNNAPVPTASASISAADTAAATTAPSAIVPPATPAPAAQTATILAPTKTQIPYGETVLPRGTQLKVISRDAQTVTVRYMDTTVRLPLQSVEIR